MKRYIAAALAVLLLAVLFVGCQGGGVITDIPEGLTGTDVAKLLLANERLSAHLIDSGDSLFGNGAEVLYALAAKAQSNIEKTGTPLGLAPASVKAGSLKPFISRTAESFSGFGESNNRYLYFKELTDRITEIATKGADLIDYVKKNIRVVDMWVNDSDSSGLSVSTFLHVEADSETLLRKSDAELYICRRYRNARGQEVYDLYFEQEAGTVRATYIAGERYEMTTNHTFDKERTDYFVADNAKGYWESMYLIHNTGWDDPANPGIANHYALNYFIIKDDISYNIEYSHRSGSVQSVSIMSADRKTELLTMEERGDSTMFRIMTTGFTGFRRITADGSRYVAEFDNGKTIEFDGGAGTSDLPFGEDIELVNITASDGVDGKTGALDVVFKHATAAERRTALTDVLNYYGLTCRRDYASVFRGMDRAVSEMGSLVANYRWNGYAAGKADALERARTAEEARVAQLVQLYTTYKDAPSVDRSGKAYELAIRFAPLTDSRFAQMTYGDAAVTVGSVTATVQDTLLFVEGEVYGVGFALQSDKGLAHLGHISGSAPYTGQSPFTVTAHGGTLSVTAPEAGEYTVVAYITTADGIRVSNYVSVPFDTVSPDTAQAGNLVVTPSKAADGTLKLTCEKSADAYIKVNEVPADYAALQEMMVVLAQQYGTPKAGAVEVLGEDGTYTALADAAVPTVGTYRLGYDTVNGTASTEGYVYLTCTAA